MSAVTLRGPERAERDAPVERSAADAGATVTLIVCGSRDRADDGAALAAVETLDPAALVRVRVHAVGEARVEELVDAAALGPVVIADAAVGIGAGVVAVIPFERLGTFVGSIRVRSTHELPIADAVALAGMLLGRSIEGAVVVIGAGDVRHGGQLSPRVRQALPRFARTIARVAVAAAERPGPAGPAGRAERPWSA